MGRLYININNSKYYMSKIDNKYLLTNDESYYVDSENIKNKEIVLFGETKCYINKDLTLNASLKFPIMHNNINYVKLIDVCEFKEDSIMQFNSLIKFILIASNIIIAFLIGVLLTNILIYVRNMSSRQNTKYNY